MQNGYATLPPEGASAAIGRRVFVKTAAFSGAGRMLDHGAFAVAAPASTPAPFTVAGRRRRYAIVGCGGRHFMCLNAIPGQNVRIADIVTGLHRPDYAPMPKRGDPVPMPRQLEDNVPNRTVPVVAKKRDS